MIWIYGDTTYTLSKTYCGYTVTIDNTFNPTEIEKEFNTKRDAIRFIKREMKNY